MDKQSIYQLSITNKIRKIKMKTFNLKNKAKKEENKEYILGLKDLNTHAVYMIYGTIDKNDNTRKLHPGKGHEEILCITQGKVEVIGPNESFSLKEGEAIHLHENDLYYLKNISDDTSHYILAGGHIIPEHK